jgi:hypothetical protein
VSERELLKLLRRGIRFLPSMIGYHCGNSEGTPCDDYKPAYVCPGHRWLRDVRRVLRKKAKGAAPKPEALQAKSPAQEGEGK